MGSLVRMSEIEVYQGEIDARRSRKLIEPAYTWEPSSGLSALQSHHNDFFFVIAMFLCRWVLLAVIIVHVQASKRPLRIVAIRKCHRTSLRSQGSIPNATKKSSIAVYLDWNIWSQRLWLEEPSSRIRFLSVRSSCTLIFFAILAFFLVLRRCINLMLQCNMGYARRLAVHPVILHTNAVTDIFGTVSCVSSKLHFLASLRRALFYWGRWTQQLYFLHCARTRTFGSVPQAPVPRFAVMFRWEFLGDSWLSVNWS